MGRQFGERGSVLSFIVNEMDQGRKHKQQTNARKMEVLEKTREINCVSRSSSGGVLMLPLQFDKLYFDRMVRVSQKQLVSFLSYPKTFVSCCVNLINHYRRVLLFYIIRVTGTHKITLPRKIR